MSWSNNGRKDLHQESKGGKFKAATPTLPFLKCILKHMITNKARKQGSASFTILKVASYTQARYKAQHL